MTSQLTRSLNTFPGTRGAGLLLSALLLAGCGQPESAGATDADAPAAPSSPASAPAEVVDAVDSAAPAPLDSAAKQSLLDAIEVSQDTAAAASQTQEERQAIIDAASAKTDAQLKAAAEAAASAETP